MKPYTLTQGSSVVLDLIRGVSAQLVVVGHGISYFGIASFLHEPNTPWMQNVAVLVFFLLSGFLITYSTVRKVASGGNYAFKHYFADRFSRIYTAFIPAIVVVFLIDLLSIYCNSSTYRFSNDFDLTTFVGNLLMLQDYPLFSFIFDKSLSSFGSARPFWTLAIEWWIYLCFGYVLLVFLKKNKITPSNLALLSFLSIVPLFNLVNGRGNGLTMFWLMGSLIYLISTEDLLRKVNPRIKVLLALMFSFLAGVRTFMVMEAYDPLFAFLLAVALWLVISIFQEKTFSKTAVTWIQFNASYSYTLYLVHYSVLEFIYMHFGKTHHPYLLFVMGFGIANILSIVIGRYTERSLTKKVKRIMYATFDN
jgi:peptidoglycan/LPS O-acetylase OafA/YrhL